MNGRIIPNPEGFVNMIHQDDCVQILLEIIYKQIWGEIFNACADTHPNRREYYIKVKKDIGNEAPVFNETEKAPFKIVAFEFPSYFFTLCKCFTPIINAIIHINVIITAQNLAINLPNEADPL